MESRTRGFLLVLLAALCLSTVPPVLKVGLREGADPLQLLAPRMILGAALLWLWVRLTRPQRMHIDAAGLRDCAIAGGINAVSLLLFYVGLRRVDATVAVLVFSIYPVLLLLFLHLLGEHVTRRDLLRLGLAMAGVALVTGFGGSADLRGVAYLVACAALYTIYMLVVQTRLVRLPASTAALWIVTFLTAGVLLMRPLVTSTEALDLAGWGVVLWSAVLGTAVARVATVEGIRAVGSAQTALLLPVETVLSVTWAALFLGERIHGLQALGAVLVIASVLLATALRRRRTSYPVNQAAGTP